MPQHDTRDFTAAHSVSGVKVKFCLEENRLFSRGLKKVWTIICFHHRPRDSSSRHRCYYSSGLVVVFVWGGVETTHVWNPPGYAIAPTAESMPKAWKARKATVTPRPETRSYLTGPCLDYFHFDCNTDRKCWHRQRRASLRNSHAFPTCFLSSLTWHWCFII